MLISENNFLTDGFIKIAVQEIYIPLKYFVSKYQLSLELIIIINAIKKIHTKNELQKISFGHFYVLIILLIKGVILITN